MTSWWSTGPRCRQTDWVSRCWSITGTPLRNEGANLSPASGGRRSRTGRWTSGDGQVRCVANESDGEVEPVIGGGGTGHDATLTDAGDRQCRRGSGKWSERSRERVSKTAAASEATR